jgi:hypothetical protein
VVPSCPIANWTLQFDVNHKDHLVLAANIAAAIAFISQSMVHTVLSYCVQGFCCSRLLSKDHTTTEKIPGAFFGSEKQAVRVWAATVDGHRVSQVR